MNEELLKVVDDVYNGALEGIYSLVVPPKSVLSEYIDKMDHILPPIFSDDIADKEQFLKVVYGSDDDDDDNDDDNNEDGEDVPFGQHLTDDEIDLTQQFVLDVHEAIVKCIYHIYTTKETSETAVDLDAALFDGLLDVFQLARDEIMASGEHLDRLLETNDSKANDLNKMLMRIKRYNMYHHVSPRYAAESTYETLRHDLDSMLMVFDDYTKEVARDIIPNMFETSMRAELTEPWMD
jgi:hypothetical protein